jgi:hypothetical protein
VKTPVGATSIRPGEAGSPGAFDDGSKCWLANGFHRLAAAERAGLPEIRVS